MAIEKNTDTWHPLLQKNIGEIGRWAEWKKLWDASTLKEDLLGLLHCGFLIEGAPEAERMCLYLSIADGYRDEGNFRIPVVEDRWGAPRKAPEAEMQLEVAQKALRMLVTKVLTNTRKPDTYTYRYPSWAGRIADPAVLEKVLWFFDGSRFDFRGRNNLPNPESEKHDDLILRAFITDFVKFCWRFTDFEDYSASENETVRNALEKTRPQLLELMASTNQLWYLVHHPRVLDEATLQKLRELASREGRYSDQGPYKTAEEAWVVGRRLAGMLLVLDPIWKKETERQAQLKEAAELEKQAERLKRRAGA